MQQAQTQRPEGAKFFARTNDVSRSTFNYVRDNPNSDNRTICEAMVVLGYKRTSVSSILSQMARVGLITRTEDGKYYTRAAEYSPVKLSALRATRNTPTPTGRKPKPVQVEKPRVVITRKEATMTPPPVAAPVPVPVASYDVDALISTLTIAQARDLFAALKRMFA